MKHFYYLLVLSLFSFGVVSAQEKLSKEEKERREKNIQAGNPFAKYGYKAKVATLSKGKYLEVHDLDSIVTIGTVRFHVDKEQIVGNIVFDSLNLDAQPIGDVTGRWISMDPLSEEFPDWSPYSFSYNSPIQFNDPTGLAPEESEATKFDVDGSNHITSTVVNKKGQIIDHKDDGDDNIYLDSRDGAVIGKEQKDKKYEVGDYLERDDLFSNVKLPKNFLLKFSTKEIQELEISPLLGGPAKSTLKYLVYLARGSKGVKYVGITSQFAIRYATHLRTKGIYIEKALEGLSKADARAVEQVLIELHKLEKNGGTLINKINSISKANPVYQESIKRGAEILKQAGINF